jgi:hypothetical protein
MKKVFVLSILCLALLATMPAFAGNVTVGLPPDPGSGNCFPWGCGYGSGGTAEYQQVYTSSAFGTGPILINDIEFFNTQFNSGTTQMNTGTWTISLSTTTADWNTLSSNFASNIGANNTQVFSGPLSQSWAFGDTLTINLSTPFLYNPSDGNLLMDVMANAQDPNGAIYFDVNSSNSVMGRVYCPSGIACSSGTVANGYGLVTGFSYGQATTPEPGTLVMFGTGVLGLAGLLRRKFFV